MLLLIRKLYVTYLMDVPSPSIKLLRQFIKKLGLTEKLTCCIHSSLYFFISDLVALSLTFKDTNRMLLRCTNIMLHTENFCLYLDKCPSQR
jgi:hypothetical protein